MIRVICQSPVGRDEIEAETPADAICGARVLFDEAFQAHPIQGAGRATSLVFEVDGEVIRILRGVRP